MSAAPRLNPPFRADHIGSLKRPASLLGQRVAFDKGACPKEELTAAEDIAIRAAVELQRETGIRAITDGEFRRCASSLRVRTGARVERGAGTCSSTACSTTSTASVSSPRVRRSRCVADRRAPDYAVYVQCRWSN
jgi:hypothetical protein